MTDYDKCKEGMRWVRVEGICHNKEVCLDALEHALTRIVNDPKNALRDRYVGVKNYAGFGDQREDHSYGRHPRHGHIVFRIERTEYARSDMRYTFPVDIVSYYLECERDFGGVVNPNTGNMMNLREAIEFTENLRTQLADIGERLESFEPETHGEERE